MRQAGKKKQGTLSIEDNQKIIALIKAKINPIQKKSFRSKLLPRNMNASAPNFYNKPSKQYQIIQAKQLNTFELLTRPPSIELIRRAKQYIEEKRKVLKYIDRPLPNIDLHGFIALFDMENNVQNQNMKEFLKMKKETLQMLTFYDKPKKVQNTERVQIQQKSSEECSLINARIRRRLNHRKIITLYRKT